MARTKQTARKTMITQTVPRRTVFHPVEGMKEEADQVIGNTQQFSLRFDDQDKCESQAVENKLIACRVCGVYCTAQSTILSLSDYKQKQANPSLTDSQKQQFLQSSQPVWICEFCLTHNLVSDFYLVTLSKEENPCIVIEKRMKMVEEKSEGGQGKILIFCVDISGSMQTYVEGKTRLESVKEALRDEINRLHSQKQVISVGLIVFGTLVKLIGDGSGSKQKTLPEELYDDFDAIVTHIQKITTFCKPLKSSYNSLKKVIAALTIQGSTALGPGLLSAVELASRGAVGSKVILCTDGEANVGIGGNNSMDSHGFYERMAAHAKTKRVMISILSLKGDKCNVKQLGKLSLATGGSIMKIDPKKLGTQFAKIVKESVIGTESLLVVKLNKIFKIRNAQKNEVSQDGTTLTQNFGNFTAQTQLTFEFDTLSKSEAQLLPGVNSQLFSCQRVPMQIQLTYTGRNGWRYLQVVTDWREITDNPNEIYLDANFSLFATSVLQCVSSKMKDGNLQDADKKLAEYWLTVYQKFKSVTPKKELQKFGKRIKKMEKVLTSKMRKLNINKETRAQVARRKEELVEECMNEMIESDDEDAVIYKEMRAKEQEEEEEEEEQPPKIEVRKSSDSSESDDLIDSVSDEPDEPDNVSQEESPQKESTPSKSKPKPKSKKLSAAKNKPKKQLKSKQPPRRSQAKTTDRTTARTMIRSMTKEKEDKSKSRSRKKTRETK